MSGDHDDRAAGTNAAAPGPTPSATKTPPLIVGYDNSPAARAALVWAACEARLRGRASSSRSSCQRGGIGCCQLCRSTPIRFA